MITATMLEAKTNLSELVRKAQNAKEAIITSGRKRKPVVRLQPIEPKKKQRLGFMQISGLLLGDAFWEPLPEDELALWNGEGD